jgi:hypothetical protein
MFPVRSRRSGQEKLFGVSNPASGPRSGNRFAADVPVSQAPFCGRSIPFEKSPQARKIIKVEIDADRATA